MDEIRDINENILKQDGEVYVRTLIFGESNSSNFNNTNILNSTMKDILANKRFDSPNFTKVIIDILKVLFYCIYLFIYLFFVAM